MKKIAIILSIVLTTLLSTVQVFAATATSSATPTTDPNLLNQINDLKEKIASKVAQLNLVEKRGVIGTVVDVNSTQITLNDTRNNTQFIDVDEITKFSDDNGNTIGISDLSKGTVVSVLGLYNKDSQRILGRFVDEVTLPVYLNGTISSIDRINGQFYIIGSNQKKILIDVEAFTKTYSFTQLTDLARSGFSKLSAGDRVFIMGYPDKTTPSMIVANRIIQLLDVAKNPSVDINEPLSVTPTESITPKPTTALPKP